MSTSSISQFSNQTNNQTPPSFDSVGRMKELLSKMTTLMGKISPQLEIEKNCDLGAINALKDASGAIYDFETNRQLNLTEKANHPTLPIDDQGNCIYHVRHPLMTSRIAYCREWQNKNA